MDGPEKQAHKSDSKPSLALFFPRSFAQSHIGGLIPKGAPIPRAREEGGKGEGREEEKEKKKKKFISTGPSIAGAVDLSIL